MSATESRQIAVFVEGKSDMRFIKAFCRHESIHVSCVEMLGENGGWTNLLNDQGRNQIKRAKDRGEHVVVILDANSNPKEKRAAIFNVNDLVGAYFLIPDNENNGCLEDLLIKIACDERVFDCFEEYKRCLENHQRGYKLPKDKSKVYAYSQARGDNPQEPNYNDSNSWDLDSPHLDPLREFLRQAIDG